MSYKTILVHIDDAKEVLYRIQLAAHLSLTFGAHLVGVASTGVSRLVYEEGNLLGVDPTLLTELTHLRERAEKTIASFTEQANTLGVPSFEANIAQDEVYGGVGLRARYADLVVLGQTNLNEPSVFVSDDFPEYMILHSGKPVLVMPYACACPTLGKRIMVAWNGSLPSMRAITAAIPLLKQADMVQVVVINPEEDSYGEAPGVDLATYLARHGVQIEVVVHRTNIAVGSALLSLVADYNSDLLVMGGYGHSRLREMIMGGTTRLLLKAMTVPVFFSH